MARRDRLTIDTSVARDYLDRDEARHGDAVKLFDLFRNGQVELVMAPQGLRLDATGDLGGQLGQMLAAEAIPEARQLPYPSEATFPSDDFFPGEGVPGFQEAWERAAASRPPSKKWPPGPQDRFHVETHVHEGRDVFLTDDRALLDMCRRLREDHGVPVVAMRLAEYIEKRAA